MVPLEQNSGALRRQYESAGAGDLIRVMEIAGQGHNYWPGFFQCEELVEFSIRQAKIGAK